MSLADAFAPAEARYRAQVVANTFGHLAPQPGKSYPGSIVFAQSEFGQLVPIRTDFEDLPDSPWFHNHLTDFVGDKATEPGQVYRFDGHYRMYKNGKGKFTGTVKQVPC
jgi:hypothetical protein